MKFSDYTDLFEVMKARDNSRGKFWESPFSNKTRFIVN